MHRTNAAPPAHGRGNARPSPRPNLTGAGSSFGVSHASGGTGAGGAGGFGATGFSVGANQKTPQLLQQMELMMKSWSRNMQANLDHTTTGAKRGGGLESARSGLSTGGSLGLGSSKGGGVGGGDPLSSVGSVPLGGNGGKLTTDHEVRVVGFEEVVSASGKQSPSTDFSGNKSSFGLKPSVQKELNSPHRDPNGEQLTTSVLRIADVGVGGSKPLDPSSSSMITNLTASQETTRSSATTQAAAGDSVTSLTLFNATTATAGDLSVAERSASMLIPKKQDDAAGPAGDDDNTEGNNNKQEDHGVEAAETKESDPYEFDEQLHEKVQMLEGCRSILGLFTSGCGPYQPILSKLFVYLFDLVESLLQEVNELQALTNQQNSNSGGGASPQNRKGGNNNDGSALVPITSSGAIISEAEAPRTAEDFKRIDYAFGKLRRMETEMKQLVTTHDEERKNYETRLETLNSEKTRLQELLEFQASRARRNRIEQAINPEEHRRRMMETVTILDLEDRIEKLKQERDDAFKGQEVIEQEKNEALELNGKYARQALEMASRVRVFQEHNERFATLLSMQYDERAATERENELLRSELVDLNKFHQLRHNLEGESGKIATTIDLRSVRYGIGNNHYIPRHLHFSGLMNRINLPKDAALSLVADLLTARGSQGKRSDFQIFIHNYLTKKHGADAVLWAYSLDETCRHNDSDPNLNLFSLVSRRQLPEELYQTIHTDIAIFLEACEAIDQMQHGELKLTVPVAHVLGILVEMFPNYPDGAFRQAMKQLETTLTTNAHAHYRLLFPNLEREGVGEADAFTHVDLRVENNFSTTFKELILDDAIVTMQQLEDELTHGTSDRVTLGELTTAVMRVFTDPAVSQQIGKQCRRIMKKLMKQEKYEMSAPRAMVVQALRESAVLRRGIFRPDGVAGQHSSARLHMANEARSQWAAVSGEELIKVNYKEVIQVTASRRENDLAAQGGGQEEIELDSDDDDEGELDMELAGLPEGVAVSSKTPTSTSVTSR